MSRLLLLIILFTYSIFASSTLDFIEIHKSKYSFQKFCKKYKRGKIDFDSYLQNRKQMDEEFIKCFDDRYKFDFSSAYNSFLIGEKRDAYFAFDNMAKASYPKALKVVGDYYKNKIFPLNYITDETSRKKSIYFYTRAAKMFNSDAMVELYKIGKRIERINMASKLRNGEAIAYMAKISKDNSLENLSKSILEKCVDDKKIACDNKIANLYKEGIYRQDYQKAIAYYTHAASRGSVDAMRELGYIYQDKNYKYQDYNKAMEWFIRARDNGDIKSIPQIAFIYMYVPRYRDFKKAYEFFLEAYRKKDKSVNYILYQMKYRGIGSRANKRVALRFLEDSYGADFCSASILFDLYKNNFKEFRIKDDFYRQKKLLDITRYMAKLDKKKCINIEIK